MLWIKAFHIIFMVCWFAGLFYLPRLFVYHTTASDEVGHERFKIMERKLYNYIMTPAAILTAIFGFWLLSFNITYYEHQWWMHIKLILVAFLYLYHIYCGRLVYLFKSGSNPHSEKFYRFFNEFPTLILLAVVILTIVKPF